MDGRMRINVLIRFWSICFERHTWPLPRSPRPRTGRILQPAANLALRGMWGCGDVGAKSRRERGGNWRQKRQSLVQDCIIEIAHGLSDFLASLALRLHAGVDRRAAAAAASHPVDV